MKSDRCGRRTPTCLASYSRSTMGENRISGCAGRLFGPAESIGHARVLRVPSLNGLFLLTLQAGARKVVPGHRPMQPVLSVGSYPLRPHKRTCGCALVIPRPHFTRRVHSTLICAKLMTLAHLSVSAATILPTSAGVNHSFSDIPACVAKFFQKSNSLTTCFLKAAGVLPAGMRSTLANSSFACGWRRA